MKTKDKPKIGLLGIMHGLYDESQPEVTENQEKYAREVIAHLDDVADIDFPGAAKGREDIERIVEKFNCQDYDGIMIVMLLYSPSLRMVQALENNKLPVLLANIQPLPEVTSDWDWSRLTTNQGIHGAQDTANILLRTGSNYSVITEDWQTEEFKSYFEDWALAARTASQLHESRIAVMEKMPGMGDILGDDVAFFRKLGPEVNHESVGHVYRYMQELTEEEIEAQMAEDRKNFEIESEVSEEQHRYAVRLQLGFEKFLQENDYDGFSAYFDVFQNDGRFKQIPILGASNLMAKGYGYAAEGDTNTATLTLAGHMLIGDPHFTEMYSLDYTLDSALMSHMGEGNWKIARKDRPVKLIDRELEIGGLSNPPTPVFSAEPGPATLVTLVSLAGEKYRLVVSKGETLDTEELKDVPMPYFHFRPENGIREAMDAWLENGGTHHQVLFLGDQRRRWKLLCKLLDVEYVEV
ncbi:MAG: L-fucose/L-arabinose isomerase family protein [Halanaerobiaceae bacterium]